MKKLLIFIFTLVVLTSNLYAHTSHYKDFKKIEMEILKDGKVIGYNYYFFEKVDDILIIKNQIQFKVNLFGQYKMKLFFLNIPDLLPFIL